MDLDEHRSRSGCSNRRCRRHEHVEEQTVFTAVGPTESMLHTLRTNSCSITWRGPFWMLNRGGKACWRRRKWYSEEALRNRQVLATTSFSRCATQSDSAKKSIWKLSHPHRRLSGQRRARSWSTLWETTTMRQPPQQTTSVPRASGKGRRPAAPSDAQPSCRVGATGKAGLARSAWLRLSVASSAASSAR